MSFLLSSWLFIEFYSIIASQLRIKHLLPVCKTADLVSVSLGIDSQACSVLPSGSGAEVASQAMP